MGFFEKMSQRLGLMDRMSDTLGADTGALAPAAYRTAVLRCASCGQGDACKGWLDRHDHANAAPGYCRNKSLLEGLATRG